MGSPPTETDRLPTEGPQHEVTIAKPFAVGRTEVSFAQWDACVAAGACRRVGDNTWGRGDRPVRPIYEELKRRRILVRYMNYEGHGDGLRISVGTDPEIDRLLAELASLLSEACR